MKKPLLPFLAIFLFGIISNTFAQTIHYVKENGTGDGTTWANASGDLQDMINTSAELDQIWVAGGTYIPIRQATALNTITTDNRNNAFVLKKDVKIYGGFAGNETMLSIRDLSKAENASILSGNLGDLNTNADNSYHVVIVAGVMGIAELNGFRIQDGHANRGGFIKVSSKKIEGAMGGGISISGSSIALTNVTLSGNQTHGSGGAMYNRSSVSTLTNVVISGNKAEIYGGGIFQQQSSTLYLTNVTMSGNIANSNSGSIRSYESSTYIRNSIIYGNSAAVYSNPNSKFFVSYSQVRALQSFKCTACVPYNKNPLFVNQLAPGLSTGGDYRLQAGSPVYNMGRNAYFNIGANPDLSSVTTDIEGRARIQDGRIDVGAYEIITPVNPTDGIAYVTATGSGNFTGSSWANATNDVQKAINGTDVEQVWVATGTYKPKYRADNNRDDNPDDRNNAFVLRKDVKIYGSFAGNETTVAQRDASRTSNISILSGDLGVSDDNTDNAYHVVISVGDVGTAELNGFSIQDGNANGAGSIIVATEGITDADGGGISNRSSSPIFTNITVIGNSAENGGGIYNVFSSSPVLTNVTVSGNNANHGGGIYNSFASSPVLTNVTISGNKAAAMGGGGMYNSNSIPEIRNTIIYGNSSGIFNSSFGNTMRPIINYSLVQELTDETNNNISGVNNPLFANQISPGLSTDGDYRLLRMTSPAYNKGNNAYFSNNSIPDLSGITTDLDGNTRIQKAVINLGAYEGIAPIYPTNGITYVTVTGAGDLRGNSWDNATNDLQKAIDATDVEQVWVAGGTYKPGYRADDRSDANPDDRNNAFVLKNGVKVYGGFEGTEALLSTRDLSKTENASILSGNLGALNTNTDNAYHVVISVGDIGTAELNGFSVIDGNAVGSGEIVVSSKTLYNLAAGGIYNHTSSPALTNLIISGNNATQGGGIRNASSSSPVLTNVVISGNNASLGGGMDNASSSPVFTNVTISGNKAIGNGGAMNNINSSPEIRNTIIYGNSTGIFNSGTSTPVIAYSLVQELSDESDGNISGDKNPLFVNQLAPGLSTGGDYRLINDLSPVYTRGNKDYFSIDSVPDLSAITTDLAGNARIQNAVINVGAYEGLVPIYPTNGIAYVTITGAGNFTGSSWANATNDLQKAIDGTDVEQVWVAMGTYKPKYRADNMSSANPNDRNNAFVLKKDVKVYGGFAGTETLLTERDSTRTNNNTILSGDIGTIDDNTDNAYHVVISAGAAGAAELNGFTIRDGNANGSGSGSAITVSSKSLDTNVGGGIYNHTSSPILKNVTINENNASENGGGMFNIYCSSILTNLIINGNNAKWGGGIYNWRSAPVLTNATLSGNVTIWDGGAIFNNYTSSPILINAIINGNSAYLGGGIYNDNSSSPLLTNVILSGNKAKWGGGMYNNNSASPIITNVTISGNKASSGGGGLLNDISSSPKIRNSIIYGNSDGIVNYDGTSNPVITFSLVQELTDETNGNISGTNDPSFVAPLTPGLSTGGDYRLASGASAAYNKGNNDYFNLGQNPDLSAITIDLDGEERIQDGIIDLGAYEGIPLITSDANGIVYVTVTGAGDLTGSDWANATDDLQRAIDGTGVEQVWVASGTYKPIHPANNLSVVDSANRDNAFVLKKDVKIYGGFAGNETMLSTRDLSKTENASILSGNLGNLNTNTDNSYHVVIAARKMGIAELNGFRIQDGYANRRRTITVSSEKIDGEMGAGISLSNSSITLTNVTISGNRASASGGAIYNRFSVSTLTNVVISGNKADSFGGGIYQNGSTLYLTNVTMSGNIAYLSGSIRTYDSHLFIRNSIIYGNSSGIYKDVSRPVITFSLVQELTDEKNGNISGTNDPSFVTPLTPGLSNGGDYRLASRASAAYNKGNNDYFNSGQKPDLSAITIDLDGEARIQDGIIDMGAYEVPYTSITPDANGIVYVTVSGNGDFSGDSWANATDDLQKAIDGTDVQYVWVATGTYNPKYRADDMSGANPDDRDNAFVLKDNIKIYGGFAGINETDLTDRDSIGLTNPTILSGDLGTDGDKSDNAYHVVISAGDVGTAELNGFSINGGNADGNGTIKVSSRNVFRYGGGGIFNSSSSPVLANVIVSGNKSDINGGGIYNHQSSAPDLISVAVSGNSATNNGGGIFNSTSSPVLTNVTISGNSADYGGGIYNESSNPILTNVTISGNYASIGGGGIRNNSSSPKIRNTIIYGNSDGIVNFGSLVPEISYSLVQGLTDETNGNINGNEDPLFVTPLSPGLNTGGNFRLKAGSSAIDKGNNDYFDGRFPDLSAIKSDLDGNNRFSNIIDLGAYEYINPLPVEIVNYNAQADGNRAKLKWTTATESNNREFIISRSSDGKNFKEIGKVAGAGNTTSQKNYVFYDENPFNGINYYQLSQVDYDGHKTDVGIRTVNFSLPNSITIYPNPVKELLQIEFTPGVYESLALTDVNGRVLKLVKIGAGDNRQVLNMSRLASGTYFIRFTGNGNVITKRVVKE